MQDFAVVQGQSRIDAQIKMREYLQTPPKVHTKLHKIQAVAEAKGKDSLKEP